MINTKCRKLLCLFVLLYITTFTSFATSDNYNSNINISHLADYIYDIANSDLSEASVYFVGEFITDYSKEMVDIEKDYRGISVYDKLNKSFDDLIAADKDIEKFNTLYVNYTHIPNIFDSAEQEHPKSKDDWTRIPDMDSPYLLRDLTESTRGKWEIYLKATDVTGNDIFDKESDGGNPIQTIYVHYLPVIEEIYQYRPMDLSNYYLSGEKSFDIDYASRTDRGISNYRWEYQLQGDNTWYLYTEGSDKERIVLPRALAGKTVVNYSLTVTDHGIMELAGEPTNRKGSTTIVGDVKFAMSPVARVSGGDIYTGRLGSDELEITNTSKYKSSISSYSIKTTISSQSGNLQLLPSSTNVLTDGVSRPYLLVDGDTYRIYRNLLKSTSNAESTGHVRLDIVRSPTAIPGDPGDEYSEINIAFKPVRITQISTDNNTVVEGSSIEVSSSITNTNSTDHKAYAFITPVGQVPSENTSLGVPMAYNMSEDKWIATVNIPNINPGDNPDYRIDVLVKSAYDSAVTYDKTHDDINTNKLIIKVLSDVEAQFNIYTKDYISTLEQKHVLTTYNGNHYAYDGEHIFSNVTNGKQNSFADRKIEWYLDGILKDTFADDGRNLELTIGKGVEKSYIIKEKTIESYLGVDVSQDLEKQMDVYKIKIEGKDVVSVTGAKSMIEAEVSVPSLGGVIPETNKFTVNAAIELITSDGTNDYTEIVNVPLSYVSGNDFTGNTTIPDYINGNLVKTGAHKVTFTVVSNRSSDTSGKYHLLAIDETKKIHLDYPRILGENETAYASWEHTINVDSENIPLGWRLYATIDGIGTEMAMVRDDAKFSLTFTPSIQKDTTNNIINQITKDIVYTLKRPDNTVVYYELAEKGTKNKKPTDFTLTINTPSITSIGTPSIVGPSENIDLAIQTTHSEYAKYSIEVTGLTKDYTFNALGEDTPNTFNQVADSEPRRSGAYSLVYKLINSANGTVIDTKSQDITFSAGIKKLEVIDEEGKLVYLIGNGLTKVDKGLVPNRMYTYRITTTVNIDSITLNYDREGHSSNLSVSSTSGNDNVFETTNLFRYDYFNATNKKADGSYVDLYDMQVNATTFDTRLTDSLTDTGLILVPSMSPRTEKDGTATTDFITLDQIDLRVEQLNVFDKDYVVKVKLLDTDYELTYNPVEDEYEVLHEVQQGYFGTYPVLFEVYHKNNAFGTSPVLTQSLNINVSIEILIKGVIEAEDSVIKDGSTSIPASEPVILKHPTLEKGFQIYSDNILTNVKVELDGDVIGDFPEDELFGRIETNPDNGRVMIKYIFDEIKFTIPRSTTDGTSQLKIIADTVEINGAQTLQEEKQIDFEVYTPVWESYVTNTLTIIDSVNPVIGQTSMLILSPVETNIFNENLVFETSEYTDYVDIQIKENTVDIITGAPEVSFRLHQDGTVSNVSSPDVFVENIVITPGERTIKWQYDLALKNTLLKEETDYVTAYFGYDLAGEWDTAGRKHNTNPRSSIVYRAINMNIMDMRLMTVRDIRWKDMYVDENGYGKPNTVITFNNDGTNSYTGTADAVKTYNGESIHFGYKLEFEIDTVGIDNADEILIPVEFSPQNVTGETLPSDIREINGSGSYFNVSLVRESGNIKTWSFSYYISANYLNERVYDERVEYQTISFRPMLNKNGATVSYFKTPDEYAKIFIYYLPKTSLDDLYLENRD